MLTIEKFGEIAGHVVKAFTVENAHGVQLTVLDYGAIWHRLAVPTASGHQNLLLNVDLATYASGAGYFGQALGRFSGRIGAGQLKVAGVPWPLPANEGTTTLHGGPNGYSHLFWTAEPAADHVTFKRHIPSALDGFPGNLDATITYTLTEADEVILDFTGTSDAATVFNPMSHAYWNLNADDATIENHTLMIDSPQRFALPADKVPTGQLLANADTAYDFTEARPLGPALAALADIPEQGYDDIFALVDHDPEAPVARLSAGSRSVTFYSSRNALVLFTANQFGPEFQFAHKTSRPYIGAVLEPETAPSAAVDPQFGNVWLTAGETRHEQARYAITY